VEGGLLLDVVIGQGAAILQLLAGKDQPLLVGGNTCTTDANEILYPSDVLRFSQPLEFAISTASSNIFMVKGI
jgi:hypothetical protein